MITGMELECAEIFFYSSYRFENSLFKKRDAVSGWASAHGKKVPLREIFAKVTPSSKI